MNQEQARIQEEELDKLLESGLLISLEKKEELESFLKKASEIISSPIPNSEKGKNKLYTEYKDSMKNYGKTLGETTYNFGLTEDEYKTIRKIIYQELEYDRQDLFIALVVKENFFEVVEKGGQHKKAFKENDVAIFEIDIHDITRISHLIGKYKVKGLNNMAVNYAEVVRKIGDISKVFENFNRRGEEMSEAGANWIHGLEKSDDAVEVEEEKVLVDKKIQPKNDSKKES